MPTTEEIQDALRERLMDPTLSVGTFDELKRRLDSFEEPKE